jgi:hypothetical protein
VPLIVAERPGDGSEAGKWWPTAIEAHLIPISVEKIGGRRRRSGGGEAVAKGCTGSWKGNVPEVWGAQELWPWWDYEPGWPASWVGKMHRGRAKA